MSFADDDQPRITSREWARAIEVFGQKYPDQQWSQLPRAIQIGYADDVANADAFEAAVQAKVEELSA